METEIAHSPIIDSYVEVFNKLDKALLSPSRKQALDQFVSTGFPTMRHEDWKYTNLAPLQKQVLLPALPGQFGIAEGIVPFIIPSLKVNQLVFINGVYSSAHSNIADKSGKIYIGTLSAALQNIQYKEIIKEFLQNNPPANNALTALNTAFNWDGAFIHVSKGVVLQYPVQLTYITTEAANGYSFHPQNIIITGENSHTTIIEAYQHNESGQSLHNVVTQFSIGANANVNYYKCHIGNPGFFHIGSTRASLERDANFYAYAVNLSGDLVRNNMEVSLNGEGAHADLKGLYVLDNKELADNHISIRHNAPRCTSNQLYKGLMDGHSTGVFNGRIYVKKDAQKTNAYQSNKNMLLSADANAYSKPQLEIFADDVKCSHGSTTGQIDKTALFYIQARGISKQNALAILNEAFAVEVLEKIPLQPLKLWLEDALAKKLHSENYMY